jgi:predicted O-linked N-acetylglucosamine transferase (SPINDLY family)/glycosyltransferase involved in cell wall biosynthesis/ubiquinone/menaquinone biosynthesis C-methylase UbiE
LKFWSGLAFLHQEKNAEAISEFKAAINLGFKHWRLGWYLGQAAAKINDLDLAKNYLAGVLKSAPNFEQAKKMLRQVTKPEKPRQIAPENFEDFTYSKGRHFEILRKFGYYHGLHPDALDLKFYQDILAYTFIVENIPPGAKLLEVGGGNSRVIEALKSDYECWNLDKFEGEGNGPREVKTANNYRLVFDYIGNFNRELPDNYFDCVFSISTLEHLPEDEATFKNVCEDLNRVLKPGGFSLHCLDVVIKKDSVWSRGILPYMFDNIQTLHQQIPFEEMKQDPDLYVMSKAAYDSRWRSLTKQSYEEFGKPVSYNILWQKQEQLSGKPTVIFKDNLPKISIVTPSLNRGEFLEECIDSVLSQNYPNLEYIIMDGGSRDGSVEIIKKYEKYLTYWQSKPDGGHYAAVNAGFSRATGEIMGWLNADDKYHAGAFFKVAAAFAENPEVEWITGRPTEWNREGKLTDIAKFLPPWSRSDLLNNGWQKYGRWIQQESTFWKRSLWEKSGGNLNADLQLAADFELWMRFSRHAQLFGVDALIGGFRSHENQRSKMFKNQYLQEVSATVNFELQLIAKGQYTNSLPAPAIINIEEGKIAEINREKMVIVTSIAPGNLKNQQRGINSWQKLGFSVVSLNPLSEIELLQANYQNVTFYPVERDARAEVGKSLVYLKDLFNYLQKKGTKICGLVNSDIRLEAGDGLIDFLYKQGQNAVIFGSRVDVENPELTEGEIYQNGFDFFFFDKELLGLFPESKFCLGLPWWDLWVPAMAIQKGLTLKYLTTSVAYHCQHEVNYKQEFWKRMGVYFTEFFNPSLSQNFQAMLSGNGSQLESQLVSLAYSVVAKIHQKAVKIAFENLAKAVNVNQGQLEKQREFWNVNSLDEAMFGRVLAYVGIKKLSPEEKQQTWQKSIQTWSPKILRDLPAKPDWKVLEVGCGVGRLIKHFRESFARVDGVDISEKMIEFAKQYLADGKQNGELYVNNGCDLQQLPEESYDFVYSTIVFQHIRSISIVKNYFSEIFRVLKPGGYFRIQVHDRSAASLGDFDEEGNADKQYYFSGNAYTEEQLKELLIEADFNLISLESSKPWIWATVRREEVENTSQLTILNNNKMGIEYPAINPLPESDRRPFWSVMLPTYKKVKYLEQTLTSVLQQAPPPEEMQIEVVNDCPDATIQAEIEAIVNRVGRGRVTFYRHFPQDIGQAPIFNICMERARGRWVHLLHDDDFVLPGFYEKLRRGVEQNGTVGAAFCRHFYIDEYDRKRWLSVLERETPGIIEHFLERIAVEQRIQVVGMAVKRRVYEQIGGFCPQAESAADWEMWKRIAAFYPIWFEPEILACFRLHSSSETSRLMRSGENIANARKAIEITQSYLPKNMAEELSNKARQHYALEAVKKAALMLQGNDASGAIAQMREGLKCSQSPPVINLLVSVLVGATTETTTPPIPNSSSSPLSKGGRGGSPFPKVIIDGIMFQIYESGITRVWRSLLQAYASQGLGDKIIVLDRNNTAPKIAGINYRSIPGYDYKKIEENRQLLQQICDEEKAEIFLSTYYTTPLSTPSVFIAYDMIPEIFGANGDSPMWKEKHFAINHASGYVAISQNTAKDLVKCFPNIAAENVTVAYCGVSRNFSAANAGEIEVFKNKYGVKKPYFLWVGDRVGFNGYKNAFLFFQAIANYPKKEELEIICVGGFTTVLEPHLQKCAEGVEVKMLRLSDEELRGAYSGALALVQTSKYEGFGLPILEAIACGCPVITNANSAIPEVAGNAAFYIGDSVEEVLKAMLEIQKLEVRKPLIAAGLERAKKFSWEAMANAISSVLIKTVNGELGSPPAPLEKGGDFSPSAALGKEVGEIEKNPLPSLGETKKAIENYREKQADKSALIKLQEIRRQIAEIWLKFSDLEELRNAYSGEIGQAHKAVLESGIKDESLTQIEQILVGQIKANLAKGFGEPLAIKYLLAGMLYRRADSLGVKYEKAPIPNWFATDYLRFMFASPSMFQEIGEADNYYRFLDGWLSYVRENISTNPNSELWGAIAWLFVQNSNWIPLYFTNTPNLKNLYLKRAEIVEFALKNRGLQLDYPIGDVASATLRDREACRTAYRPPNREKIRLGILKDHYAPQTETYSLLPVFEHLDRSKFEIILYAVKSNGHPLEQYCQSRADKFLRLPDDLETQAQTIRNDDLDILFVGSNVTAGMKNSTLLAMHRLARVQVASINSPTTTGMRNVDYYIAGTLTAPAETFPEHYTEKLVNLEGSGLCFRYAIAASPPAVQPIRSSWGATEETTIFISGANFYKIVPELRETWAKILAAVPDSILVLYPFNPNWTSSYPAAPLVQQMRSVLERHGIDRKRLVVIKALPGKSDIEQCLQLADVYLDSFPYGGATSLVDPLTVGVPPVVVEGDALRFRQASAMLREIGTNDLIADSEESYINIAVQLATNPQWRQQKREEIKAKMQQNPPFLDSRGYSAKMGALLERLLAGEIHPPPPLERGEPEEVKGRRTGILPVPEAEVQDDRRTGILPVRETEVQAALSSEFLNRIMGCVNLYEIEPDDESLVGELRQLRLELAAFWMGAAPEQLESVYRGEMRQAYRALLACGFQNEALTADEEGFLQHLTEVSAGLSQPKAVNALLGAMLYFPQGKMRVRDAASRLPQWLIEDYQEVFENLPAGSEAPPRPPLERGEEEATPLQSQDKDGDPPRPPLERGEEEVETEKKEMPVEQKFVNEVLGSVHLYYIEPSDESVVDRLRQLRRQMADLCLQLPAEELEGFYRGEVGKGFKALLNCGFQNEPMLEEEVAFLQEVAIALAKGIEAPKAVNHLLAAMLYCRRGQLQVEDTSKLPQWLLEDYQKFASGESPLVVAG